MPTVISIEDLRRNPTVVLFEGGDEVTASIFVTENVRGEGPTLHVHPYPEIFLVEAGTATFTVAGEEITVTEGHFVIVPAETPHGYRSAADETLRVVSFQPSGTVKQTFLES